jgi:3-oxoacyl-[acyl-carrier protein] reductase
MELQNKTALVTGAARGIGKEIAVRLARHGADVALVDIEKEAVEETALQLEQLGVKAGAYHCDVSVFDDVGQIGGAVRDEFGHVDILVNNAGVTRDRLLMRMTPDDWNRTLSVNLTGAFNLSKVFSPPMLKRCAGSIVNITSVVGQMGNAGQANYAASKAGVIGLTKALAKEFAGRGVRVNAVAPGFIRTAMTETLNKDVQEKTMATIPLGRFGEPEDVANVVLFLVSDMAGYITGQVINCDGGLIMAR